MICEQLDVPYFKKIDHQNDNIEMLTTLMIVITLIMGTTLMMENVYCRIG
jgi:hypothetical protein